MLPDDVINSMDLDELRNLVHHMNNLQKGLNHVISSGDKRFDAIQGLFNANDDYYTAIMSARQSQTNLWSIEHELITKYSRKKKPDANKEN